MKLWRVSPALKPEFELLPLRSGGGLKLLGFGMAGLLRAKAT